MTYNASIPLNSDSPAIFPAQSQTNYTRLQTIVGADHQFNLIAAANDGWHTLIHMIPQAPTGILASTGRLYSKSASGLIQLFYMDDAGTEYQLTPQEVTEVSKISGTAALGVGADTSVLNAAYDYTGFGTVLVNGTSTQATYNFMRSGAATDIHRIDDNGSPFFPTLSFTGTDLRVKNNAPVLANIIWSLMVNRL